MNIPVGSPVWGADFFDREETLDEVWEILKTNSVLLAAPRRVGKTSIMRKMYDDPQSGFNVLLLDGEDYTTPEDLIADLVVKAGELKVDRRHFFRKWLGREQKWVEAVEVWELKSALRDGISGSWRAVGQSVVEELAMDGFNVVMVIDELAILLHKMTRNLQNGAARAQELLDWLRHVRQERDLCPHVRQVLGDSIGLPRVASLLGCSHKINDLRAIEIGPFDRPTAKRLATELLASRGVSLREQVMEAFLDQIETFLPIFVQIMASAVAAEVRRRKQEATAELIQECYEQRALGPEFRMQFEDYYDRLDRYYSPEESRIGKSLLRELAMAPGPLSKSHLLGIYQKEFGSTATPQRFDLFMTWLRDDFYLVENGEERIAFKSRWLRDWWRRHHGSKSQI